MINLFNIPDYTIDTSKFNNWLNGTIVNEFENNLAKYVGAKHCVTFDSATNAIYLLFKYIYHKRQKYVSVPTMLPQVVLNSLVNTYPFVEFTNNTDWIGNDYVLYETNEHRVIDSAQRLEKDLYKNLETNDKDLMIFSFYPTKPVGSISGGAIVSNDNDIIEILRTLANNGMSGNGANWEKKAVTSGYRMFMNTFYAYIANENLKKLDEKNYKLSKLREIYNNEFNQNKTSNHLYQIETNDNKLFIQKAKDNGIVCGIHYDCLHKIDFFKRYATTDLSKSEYLSKRLVSIPFNEKLTDTEILKVIKFVNENK